MHNVPRMVPLGLCPNSQGCKHTVKFTLNKLCVAVGLHKILSLLESEDVDVRVHAVKVVANLAAEGEVFEI